MTYYSQNYACQHNRLRSIAAILAICHNISYLYIDAMKFKEAFEKCQAELKANKTGNHLPDDMAKMATKDEERMACADRNTTHHGDQSNGIVTVTVTVDDHESM